jgi:gamma-glutamyltranspeptidase
MLYREHGFLPLSQIMAVSIKYAKNGFEVLPGEANRHAIAYDDKRSRLQKSNNRIPYFIKREILKQLDLANTLKECHGRN